MESMATNLLLMANKNPKEGTIIDYITNKEVKATPEEIEAVQVFSKILVEDYGYSKTNIQTHPQYRVKVRPSDTKKEYPVDIAVFNSEDHNEDTISIIVECKKKDRKDGITQLQDYLRFSRASLGVWFNGEAQVFIRKYESNGRVEFEEIPNIPKFGQRVEDIGKYKRRDLQSTHNLKPQFKAIRYYLAANAVGVTRDEVIAQQIINIIFCKIYDEKFTNPDDEVSFRAGIGEDLSVIKDRINILFSKVKDKYYEVFDDSDSISLDAESLKFVVGTLQGYCLIEAERDVIADAFETFIDHALKGGQGQFFTPRNIIQMMVEILGPNTKDTIIDPACGSGGFIIESLRYVWHKLDIKAKENNWNHENLYEEKKEFAIEHIRGIDKDYFLSKVAKAYFAILGDGRGGVFCEDSLEDPINWKVTTQSKIHLDSFSIVLTNPPFGAKIPVTGEAKLKQYELGYKWKLDKKSNQWKKDKLLKKEAPQILFIERCIKLLRDKGRMAIVLPDGVFGNAKLGYIRKFIAKHCRIVAIIDIPIESFMPNTSTKTSVLFVQKTKNIPSDYPIFMCVVENCGHDRRGKDSGVDDISSVSVKFKKWKEEYNFNW